MTKCHVKMSPVKMSVTKWQLSDAEFEPIIFCAYLKYVDFRKYRQIGLETPYRGLDPIKNKASNSPNLSRSKKVRTLSTRPIVDRAKYSLSGAYKPTA